MGLLSKASGMFSSALGSVFDGPGDLERLRRESEFGEAKRLKKLSLFERKQARLMTKEGVGVAERPDVTLGFDREDDDVLDEQNIIESDTGLIL